MTAIEILLTMIVSSSSKQTFQIGPARRIIRNFDLTRHQKYSPSHRIDNESLSHDLLAIACFAVHLHSAPLVIPAGKSLLQFALLAPSPIIVGPPAERITSPILARRF
jgi:hypothetical protein